MIQPTIINLGLLHYIIRKGEKRKTLLSKFITFSIYLIFIKNIIKHQSFHNVKNLLPDTLISKKKKYISNENKLLIHKSIKLPKKNIMKRRLHTLLSQRSRRFLAELALSNLR